MKKTTSHLIREKIAERLLYLNSAESIKLRGYKIETPHDIAKVVTRILTSMNEIKIQFSKKGA